MKDKKRALRAVKTKAFLGKAIEKIKNISPALLQVIGAFVPGVHSISELVAAIIKDPGSTEKEKEIFIAAAYKDVEIEKEISKRWLSDNNTKHWLPSLIRPLVLANYTILVDIVVLVSIWGQPLPQVFLPLLLSLAATVTGGYFALREFGKTKKG